MVIGVERSNDYPENKGVRVMKTKMDLIKEYLMETNHVDTIASPWNEGFIIGLHFGGAINDEEMETLMEFIAGEWYKNS